MIKFHVYDTGQITRTGSLALQARKSTRTTRRSKVRKNYTFNHLSLNCWYLIIQPLEALFVWTERLVLFDFLCVCLSTEAPTRWKPCWRKEAKTDSRRTVQSMYWISDRGSSKCERTTEKNSCSLKFQSFYFHLFMLWIFLEFFGYFDGENDVIIPHICSVSKAQPCQSPRKVWWNLHSRPGMCGSESKCYCWIMQTEHSWCNLVQGQG